MAAGSSFGTFLNLTNGGPVGAKPAANAAFDLEMSAKMALQSLWMSASSPKDLRDRLGLTDEQTEQVLDYLVNSKMVERPREDEVALTSFARVALDVFSIV